MITTPAVVAVLSDLVGEGTLTPAQAARVAERLTESLTPPVPDTRPERSGKGGRLAEIAGYAGGALLLGAVALFLTSGWQDLSDASRVVILIGTSVLLVVAGGLIGLAGGSVRALGRVHDSARRRLVSVLWTFAASTAAGAASLSVSSDARQLVAASAVGLVIVCLGYALVPSAVAQLGAWLAAVGLVCGLIAELGDHPNTTSYAVALLTLGAIWVGLAVANVLREQQTGLALGAGLALFAAQLPVLADGASGLGYALTAAVALAGFAGYLATRSWPVLGAGVIATTLVVPEALHDETIGSVSSAGSLLIAGLTLLAASATGLRLRRDVG